MCFGFLNRRAYLYINVASYRRVILLKVLSDKCHVNSVHHLKSFIYNDDVCRLSKFFSANVLNNSNKYASVLWSALSLGQGRGATCARAHAPHFAVYFSSLHSFVFFYFKFGVWFVFCFYCDFVIF